MCSTNYFKLIEIHIIHFFHEGVEIVYSITQSQIFYQRGPLISALGAHINLKLITCIILFTDLSKILQLLLIKYDNLFETEFPYSMGWHGKYYLRRLYHELPW